MTEVIYFLKMKKCVYLIFRFFQKLIACVLKKNEFEKQTQFFSKLHAFLKKNEFEKK
jgi:hypothetical protein